MPAANTQQAFPVITYISSTCAPHLFNIFTRGHSELLLEASRKVRQSAEAGHIGNLRDIVLSLTQKLCCSIELVSLEEHARILTSKTLHLIIELGS